MVWPAAGTQVKVVVIAPLQSAVPGSPPFCPYGLPPFCPYGLPLYFCGGPNMTPLVVVESSSPPE